MVRTKVMTVVRWYAQDEPEVNQEDSEQNEVDGMKKGADSTGKVMHMWKSGWWFVMRKSNSKQLSITKHYSMHHIAITAMSNSLYRSQAG